jgi:hypothetical protein
MADMLALGLQHDEQTALVAVDLALSEGVATRTPAHGDEARGAELRVETPASPDRRETIARRPGQRLTEVPDRVRVRNPVGQRQPEEASWPTAGP